MLPEYSNNEYLLKKYTEAYENKDRELLEYIRMVPIEDVDKLLPIYQKLIIEDWHIENEDMIGYFQRIFNKDKKSIPYLEKCIRSIPRYLQFGDMKSP